jgi:hypothetical protein
MPRYVSAKRPESRGVFFSPTPTLDHKENQTQPRPHRDHKHRYKHRYFHNGYFLEVSVNQLPLHVFGFFPLTLLTTNLPLVRPDFAAEIHAACTLG